MPFIHRKKEKGNGQELKKRVLIGVFIQLCVKNHLDEGCSNFLKLKVLKKLRKNT